jgi:putative pyruvate formate lyase activating enzyme
MMSFEPAYLDVLKKGLLKEKIKKAYDIISDCTLCPRKCRVNRIHGKTGICKTGVNAYVSSYNPHFGEEAPLVGSRGSGTIFFTHCNLMCIFCQNYDISHDGYGREISTDQLATIMLDLQSSGCHNINFVSPSHVVPQILDAVEKAAGLGLKIPLIYNTGGYDNVDTLKLLEGVIDIYMPDFKFWDPGIASTACDAEDYPHIARRALMEMHRQVGDLVTDASGIARHGLIIRHLVLPQGLAGTRNVMKFIAAKISTNSYINIMTQYRPCGRAAEIRELSASPSKADFREAIKAASDEGLTRLDQPRRVFMFH